MIRIGFLGGLCLAALTFGAAPASAQTIGFAEAYDRLAKGCGKDVDRFCGNVELGGGKVKACLDRNQAKLSAGCKATMAETFALLNKRLTAQANAVKVCDRDIQQYCHGARPYDGYRLHCLIQSVKVVSNACQQTITDAGWRD
jgi:hypothetical protein